MTHVHYRYDDLTEYDWLHAEVDRHETDQALALGALLHDRLAPGTVIDVGCSSGVYLVPFKARGVEIYGIDGSPGAGYQLALAEFELVDLRNPWTPAKRYDLALCIEVAEHLQPIHAETLVATLSRCADKIYFSAARAGQGGEGHYNEQDRGYWLEMFGRYGYARHAASDEIQQMIDRDQVYDHCHWLRWNGMLLGKQ
jgi:SAM-dependent methyltransferase